MILEIFNYAWNRHKLPGIDIVPNIDLFLYG